MKLAELFVQITGQPQSLYSTLDAVHARLAGFGNMRIPLGGMFAGLAGAAGLVGVGAAMKSAVQEAMTLEKAYSQIRKTTGLTAEELEQLKTKLVRLSTTMAGVKVEEVNEIAAMAGRLGIQGVEGIASFTKSIAMIRVALDDIPAEEAATRISRILNVFKLGPESALDFASALNKLDDTSTATGRDILNIASRMSGTASTLGISPQKLLALAATMKDAGVESEIAASAIDRTLMLMATDTADFAKVAGVSTKQFADAFKGDALAALKMFLAGLSGLEKTEQLKALAGLKLHGVEASGTLLQLNQVIGKLEGNVAVANSEWKSHASILSEVDIQGQTTYAQLDLLWNNVKLTAGDLASLLLPALKDAAAGFGEMAASIRENFASLQTTVSPAIQAIRSGIETAMLVFRNFGDIVALTALDVSEANERIGAGAEYLVTVFKAAFDWIVTNAGKIGEALLGAFSDPVDSIRSQLTGLMGILAKLAKFEMPTLDDFAATLPKAMKKAMSETTDFKMPEFKFDASGFDKARDDIKDKMAAREAARLDDKAKKAGDVAQGKEVPKQEEGKGKAPDKGKGGKYFSGGLEEFSKHLQAGIFGKDEAAKKTAENTGKLVAQGEAAKGRPTEGAGVKKWRDAGMERIADRPDSPELRDEIERKTKLGNIQLPTARSEIDRIANLGVKKSGMGDDGAKAALDKAVEVLEQINRTLKGQKPSPGMAVGGA